jgi:hypothetical protein
VTGQQLDVTTLGDGGYCLRSYADPEGRLLESEEQNNSRGTRIELRGDTIVWKPYRRC